MRFPAEQSPQDVSPSHRPGPLLTPGKMTPDLQGEEGGDSVHHAGPPAPTPRSRTRGDIRKESDFSQLLGWITSESSITPTTVPVANRSGSGHGEIRERETLLACRPVEALPMVLDVLNCLSREGFPRRERDQDSGCSGTAWPSCI